VESESTLQGFKKNYGVQQFLFPLLY